MLSNGFAWPGMVCRSEYIVPFLTAMWVSLQHLSTPTRCFDLPQKFGLFASQRSEVFWEHVDHCVESYGYTLGLRSKFMRSRAELYADLLVENGSPLDSVVAFIDSTKIRIAHPGGPNHSQQAVYSSHRRQHCLMYQTSSTSDGLITALYGPIQGHRHDLALLRQIGWEDILSDMCNI